MDKQVKLKDLISENLFNSLEDYNMFDDIPSIRMQIIDQDGEDKLFLEMSTLYHSGDNKKITILKNNPDLQEKVMQLLQQKFQSAFREVIHGVLGEPFGLDESE